MTIKQFFKDSFEGKKTGILGFGREGQSTYTTLKRYIPDNDVIIADSNPAVRDIFLKEYGEDTKVKLALGASHINALATCDIVFKSPGVSLKGIDKGKLPENLIFTSQTEVFLRLFADQLIGVTGTKGKSTTVSLLQHLFLKARKPVLLVGNIGIPPFSKLEEVTPSTTIIGELSSHQLEHVTASPATAVVLNIFQEHLDHYDSYNAYQHAKMNIARWQKNGNILIYNSKNEIIREQLMSMKLLSQRYALGDIEKEEYGADFMGNHLAIKQKDKVTIIDDIGKERKLPGKHNLINIGAAAVAAFVNGVPAVAIKEGIASFAGLPHRLEFVGEYDGVRYYNDSISTIPESTIQALQTFSGVQTLLLGGHDRGVDYRPLIEYLVDNQIANLIFMGKAGQRMLNEYRHKAGSPGSACYHFFDFEKALQKACAIAPTGSVCLMSPAASSYDSFSNFEERGEAFRKGITLYYRGDRAVMP